MMMMLDIKVIRENPELAEATLKKRSVKLTIAPLLSIDERRRELLKEEEAFRNERNSLSKQVGELKKAGQDATAQLEASKHVADKIKSIETEKETLAVEQEAILLNIPNFPADATPVGSDETQNVEISRWGCEFKTRNIANPKDHWEIGETLGWLDFERGVKVAKSRFSVFRREGAKLTRALIRFMLDVHTHRNGYEEIMPPLLVNEASMQGTGQLPKFRDDLFKLGEDDLFLIPTAEVPLTNLYRDELLSEAQLPIQMVGHTPCFRREAGSAGRDTRGLIRQHQFDKVELVQIVRPEDSAQALKNLTAHAEGILKALELPYRVVALCTGDLGFSAAQCFDLEVWMAAQGVYREISSCSNMTDFQARRMNLRYRSEALSGKPAFCHTLNGSGLAVGRTVAAILENYQVSETEVVIPKVLQPYMETPQSTLRLNL